MPYQQYMHLYVTITDKDVFKLSPNTVSKSEQFRSTSSLSVLCSFVWAVQAASRVPVCFTAGRLTGGGLWKGRLWPELRGCESSWAPVWSVSGTNVVSGAGGLRRWKPLAATRPRQESLVVGAGVGDKAQELCPFSASTPCGGRDWAVHGLWKPRVSPAEPTGITHSTDPHPDRQDEARSVSPH